MRPISAHARRLAIVSSLISVVAGGACSETLVPNYNSPNVDGLLAGPNATTINATTLGLLVGARGVVGTYAQTLGIFGREIYNLDQADARFVLSWLQEPLTPGGFGTDLGWTATYRQLLTAQTILDVVDRVPDYSATQKEAVRGFTKTFMAMAYHDQLRVRDTFGLVLDVDPTAKKLGAFVTREEGYTRAAALFDEAKTHLAAGGTAFPFSLPTGFAGFNTPANFVRVNRSLKARLDLDRKNWNGVLTDLAESFISTTTASAAALATGVYHTYSSAAGDATNPMFDPAPRALVAHPSFLTDAQRRADNTPDLRTAKVSTGALLSNQGLSSNLRLAIWATNVTPLPLIRNEELVLMRAEANIGLGNRAAAIPDLNFVRVNAGGLAPLASDFSGDLVSELLYNRRYSLFAEYGHRWVDMRRWDRLAQLPKALPAHKIYPIVPLPSDECSEKLRPTVPKGCVQVSGF